MDSAVHAARGALVSGGGLTLLQCTLARKLQRPSSLAISLGSFVGTFRLLESLGSKLRSANDDEQEDSNAHQRRVSSVAAGAAALVALYALEGKRRAMFISYASLEALLLLASEHTSLADIKHMDAAMAVLACNRIIYQWIYTPHSYTKAQLATLDALTAVPAPILAQVRADLAVNAPVSRCDLFHAGQSCSAFTVEFMLRHIRKAMKLYIPIYFVSAVLAKHKQWLFGPRPSVLRLVVQYLRTCLSLSMSFVIPIGFSCFSPIPHHRATVHIAGALTALSLWIDHEKRRSTVIKAIAVYPFSAFATQLGDALGLSQSSRLRWQYALFSLALAVLFSRPERQSARAMQLLYGHKLSGQTVAKPDTKPE